MQEYQNQILNAHSGNQLRTDKRNRNGNKKTYFLK